MMNYYELGEKLLKEISEEKGFSFKKWFYLYILPIRIPCRKPSLPVFCR